MTFMHGNGMPELLRLFDIPESLLPDGAPQRVSFRRHRPGAVRTPHPHSGYGRVISRRR